jgi:hypothetical protein
LGYTMAAMILRIREVEVVEVESLHPSLSDSVADFALAGQRNSYWIGATAAVEVQRTKSRSVVVWAGLSLQRCWEHSHTVSAACHHTCQGWPVQYRCQHLAAVESSLDERLAQGQLAQQDYTPSVRLARVEEMLLGLQMQQEWVGQAGCSRRLCFQHEVETGRQLQSSPAAVPPGSSSLCVQLEIASERVHP